MPGALLILMMFLQPSRDAVLEQRVMALSQQLRCLVCQNETLADSQADLAADLRRQIREQMVAGRTDSEITTFLTDRYGDFVLYRPRVRPQTYALWFGPFVLLAVGWFVLLRFLKRWPSLKVRSMTAGDRRRATELLQLEKDPNVAVYREQLAELEADLRNGLIMREQYESDSKELDRRVLEDCRNA